MRFMRMIYGFQKVIREALLKLFKKVKVRTNKKRNKNK